MMTEKQVRKQLNMFKETLKLHIGICCQNGCVERERIRSYIIVLKMILDDYVVKK